MRSDGPDVCRGGAWNSNAQNVRSGYRNADDPSNRWNDNGFRLARAHEAPGRGHGTRPHSGPLGVSHHAANWLENPDALVGSADATRRLVGVLLVRISPVERTRMTTTSVDAAGPLMLQHPLAGGLPPSWASAWGEDRNGPWCAFELAGVEFRMRWIPQGTFQMGTPETEPGRSPDEGPQHQVTISDDFWLGEVPVTQRQWEAVMDDNPSRFKSSERPVEQVSWEDAHSFIDTANRLDAELALRLPIECEWEHACRAGTDTATYLGDMVIRGPNDAPVLETIAWYGGNSAEGFELENGHDNSAFASKSGKTGKAGTHPVGQKQANALGLRDMLGNVWEWCEDGQRTYANAAEVDPRGPEGQDVRRVCRGGAWGSNARYVRSGYRLADDPSSRWVGGGFRLARGPGAVGRQANRAEPGSSEPRSGAERQATTQGADQRP